MNMSILKMSDGTDVLVKIIDDNNTNFLLVEKARVVVFQQNPESGQVGVAFPPWSQVAGDSEIEINRSHIVMTLNTLPKALEDAYLANTSGIALS